MERRGIDFYTAPERVFQVWLYTVGMGRLLLRSTKTPTFGTRVDLYFQDVQAMKLPTRLEGVTVRPPLDEERRAIEFDTGLLVDEETRLYILDTARGRSGYVVAGVLVADERDAEFYDPSAFDLCP